MKRGLRRLFVFGAVIYALTFMSVFSAAASFENPDNPPNVDFIVCLGGGALDDGSLLYSSVVRAETCADLYLQGVSPTVLMTGANANGNFPSVAQAMAAVAMTRGVPSDAILLEEDSQSTLQNALFSKPLLQDADSLLLVTHGYHLHRSKLSFQAIGPWEIALWSAGPFDRKPDGSISWKALHRETLAIWFNLARFGVWWLGTRAGLTDIDGVLI